MTTGDHRRELFNLPTAIAGRPRPRCCIKTFEYPKRWRICSGDQTTKSDPPLVERRAGFVFAAEVVFIDDPSKSCFCECCLFTQLANTTVDDQSAGWAEDCTWALVWVGAKPSDTHVEDRGSLSHRADAANAAKDKAKSLPAKFHLSPSGRQAVKEAGYVYVEKCYGDSGTGNSIVDWIIDKFLSSSADSPATSECDKSFEDRPSARIEAMRPHRFVWNLYGEIYDRCRQRLKRAEQFSLTLKRTGDPTLPGDEEISAGGAPAALVGEISTPSADAGAAAMKLQERRKRPKGGKGARDQ